MNPSDSKEFKELLKLVPNPVYYSVSGAHLYGWESPDSDIDVRGSHIIPLKKMIGLGKPKDVVEKTIGLYDFVSFDIGKEISLLMANNCNVLENVLATPFSYGVDGKYYGGLKQIARGALSKVVSQPYRGLARSNYEKFIAGKSTVSSKKYLYVLRSLMAAIYCLRYGRIEADLRKLNADSLFRYALIDELVAKKRMFKEKEEQKANYEAEKLIKQLNLELGLAEVESSLPDTPQNKEEANQFLIDTRLKFL